MFSNGFVIKQSVQKDRENPYHGIGCWNWPLSAYWDKEQFENKDKLLVDEIDNILSLQRQRNSSLDIISDIDLVKSYYQLCRKIGIPVEVLFIRSELSFPDAELVDYSKFEFLGYDVGEEDNSIIYNDMPRIEMLGVFQLNQYGLLSNATDASRLRELRSRLREIRPGKFEPTDDMIVFGVYRCNF